MIDHFNAYVLAVKDIDKCITFYRDMLGLQVKDREGEFAYLVFKGQDRPGLALMSVQSTASMVTAERVQAGREAFHRNYFAAFVEDVDKEYQELKSKGVHFVRDPTTHPWGQRIAYFEDPEGNLWEISHFIKK